MLKKSIKPKILDLLSKKFEEEAFASLFVIDVTTNDKSGFIRVYLDGDAGVKFSDCQKISRYLESYLDEEAGIMENYTLEVSSPGIKRSLENIRQYPQHIGRVFKVIPTEENAKDLNVKLIAVEEEKLRFETLPPKKKKKGSEKEIIELGLDEIKEAVVKISFN